MILPIDRPEYNGRDKRNKEKEEEMYAEKVELLLEPGCDVP